MKNSNPTTMDALIEKAIRALVNDLTTVYYGCILSELKRKESLEIPRFAVSPDGELLYNPTYKHLTTYNHKRILRDLIHEAGHIAFEHFFRKEHLNVKGKNHTMFNIAADCSIESIFEQEMPYLPPCPEHHKCLSDHIPRNEWDMKSTEQMYASIKVEQADSDDPQDSHIPILTPEGKEAIKGATKQAQKKAVDLITDKAKKAASVNCRNDSSNSNDKGKAEGKGAGTSPTTTALLGLDNKDFVFSSFDVIKDLFKKSFGREGDKDDSVFNQRNMLRRDFAGMPLLGRHQRTEAESFTGTVMWHNDVTIFADVSGSMSKESIINGFRLILKLAKDYGVDPITVHTYNTDLVQTFTIEATTNLDSLNIKTGGGTNIYKVLERVKPQSVLVFVLTDMEDRPVSKWANKGKLVWLIHDNYSTSFDNFTIGEKICINDIIKGN